jgi:hypothetical protein
MVITGWLTCHPAPEIGARGGHCGGTWCSHSAQTYSHAENSSLDPSACAIEHDDAAAIADYAMTIVALNASAACGVPELVQSI